MLNTEAVWSPETSMNFYETMGHYAQKMILFKFLLVSIWIFTAEKVTYLVIIAALDSIHKWNE
jgi:hypothetical protein